MNDPLMVAPTEPAGPAAPAAVAAEPAPHFGAGLAAARTRAGLGIAEMASRLRLHPRQIEALEAADLAHLPSAPYVRGFVRNYARELRIDPQPALRALEHWQAAHGVAEPVVAGAAGRGRRPLDSADWRRGMLLLGVGVLAAALVIGSLWPQVRGGDAPAGRRPAAVTSVVPAPAPAAPAEAAPAAPATDPATAAGLLSAPAAQPAAVATAPTANDGAAVPAGAATSVATSKATSTATSTASVLLRASQAAWVQVIEPDGNVLLSHTVAAGSVEQFRGRVPLRMVVGNAAAVSVEVRGKPYDLAQATTPGGVARLTIE